MLNSGKIMKIMSTLNLKTPPPPLQLNLDIQSKKKFLPHCVKLFFGEKPSTHNNVAPKVNACGQKSEQWLTANLALFLVDLSEV